MATSEPWHPIQNLIARLKELLWYQLSPPKWRANVFLITGVSEAGIGGAIAKALASGNPKLLVLTGSSETRVKPVISDINKPYPTVQCQFLSLDLASESSVRKAAAEVNTYSVNIDVLINNAGTAQVPERKLNDAGIEMHSATNHIGHFLFTNLIMPKLEAAAKGTEAAGSVRNCQCIILGPQSWSSALLRHQLRQSY